MQFISKELEAYCLKYSAGDTVTLQELSKTTWETEESPQMISGALTVSYTHLTLPTKRIV